jgi:hypothetical protein
MTNKPWEIQCPENLGLLSGVLVPFPTGRPTKTTGEYVYFFEASHANSRFERVWEISRDPLQRCFQNRVCWEPENQTTIYSNPHKGRGYNLPTSH